MKIYSLLLTLISFFLIQNLAAQDINQKVAIKDFKAGEYKNWDIRNFTLTADGTRSVSYKYDDDGNVNTVIIGEDVYEISSVSEYYGNKIVTGTHFASPSGLIGLVYHNKMLLIFKRWPQGEYKGLAGIIRKKGGDCQKAAADIEEYVKKIQDIEKEKKKDLKELVRKNNPETVYKKVHKESEGLRKVETKEGKIGFIDSEGNLVIETMYDRSYDYFTKGVLGVEIGNKQGYINTDNEIVIKIENYNVKEVYNDLIIVQKNNKGEYNVYDMKGKIKFGPFDYSSINKYNSAIYIKEGRNHGLIAKDQSIDWFMKNVDYSSVFVGNQFYKITKGSKSGVYDPKTKIEILTPSLDKIYEEVEGCYVVKHNEKYGLFSGTKKCFITEVIYDDAFSFSEGKAKIEHEGIVGYSDLSGNIVWSDGARIKGVNNKLYKSTWRNQYDDSGVLIEGEYAKVLKGNLYGFVNDEGNLKLPVKYSSATNFKNGVASVVENGKAKQISMSGVEQEYTPGLGNSIEMSFSYAHNDDKSFHFGVIWDKKSGDNKIYYSKDIYQYDFSGSKSWVLPKEELMLIMGSKGDILMKAQAYIEQDNDNYGGTEILVWNTFTGKFLLYEYNEGFKIKQKRLENSPYMSEKGGRVMYDYEVDYAQGEEGYDPDFGSVIWNTYTGENSLVEDGESPFSFDPKVDGEIMFDLDLAIESSYDSRGGFILVYTTKTLKKYAYHKYSGSSYLGSGRFVRQSYSEEDGETEFDFQVNVSSMYQYKSNSMKDPAMIIFNKKERTNNIGLGLGTFQEFKEDLLDLPSYKYSSIAKADNEIGMFQITNEQKGKLEFWFWDKSTGHFTVCLYTNNNGNMEFVTPFAVYENLLTIDWGVKPYIAGGELSASQLEAGTKPKPVKDVVSNSSSNSSNSNSSNTSSSNTSSGPKLVQVSVNPNGKAKNMVHIHWSENGSSKKKSLQTKSTGVVGKIPEGTKLYYSIDNESSKTFFYEVPTGKSNASVTIK